MRIFVDANIIFSAARSAGAIREMMHRLRTAGHTLCADEYVMTEARRNLIAKNPEALLFLDELALLLTLARYRQAPLPDAVADLLPEKDRPVLAAALGLGCDVLVTGDRTHFVPLYGKTIGKVTVHSPRSLAEAIDL